MFQRPFKVLFAGIGRRPARRPASPRAALAGGRPVRDHGELAQSFMNVPIGLALVDGAGVVLRTNPVFDAWIGVLPPRLDDAPLEVRALIGWADGGFEEPGAGEAGLQVRTAVFETAPTEHRTLRASVRRLRTVAAEARYLVSIEDRSAEVQRDLAHAQIGAMMTTAGVGVATFAASPSTTPAAMAMADGARVHRETASNLPSTPAGVARIGRELVSSDSLAEYERLQAALREGRRAEVRYEIHHPDHGARWLLTRVEPSVLGSGERTTSVVTVDVTEQERGQAQSRALQRELKVLGRDRELMFSLSEVGIAFVRDRRIHQANEAMAALTGWSVPELARCDLAALAVGSDAFEREHAEEAAAMARDGRWSGERQLRRRDGRLVWVQVSKRPVHRERPSEGLIASYVDVDARHRAERAVALQAERTRSILDSALVGIVNVGPRGIEWMNRSAQRMFGGALPEFVGEAMSCVATPEAEHPFRRTSYLDELVEGEAETFECRVRARDGREFWVVGNAVATGRERGGRQLTYALMDIERRRQAEARLSEAQAALQQVISAAPLAIALIDARRFAVIQVNEVAAAALQSTPEQLIGRTPEQIWPERIAAARCADLRAALREPGVTIREYRAPRSRHAPARIWDARYVPLSRAAGEPPDRLLLVATDVTEQRAAQQARLDAAIEQREMLVREVHHRIKNNLQGVAGLLQQIAQRKPEVASVISEVVGQVQAIAHVHGLQVGTGGELRLTGVIEAISASVQRTFGQPIRCRGVEGGAGSDWALPDAEAIPIALILNELLTNAVKHGSRDDAPGAAGAPAEIACELACEGGGARIEVSNPGDLPTGFSIAGLRGGVSGLGLVRALLPRRHAELSIERRGGLVVAAVVLRPPVVAATPSSALPGTHGPAGVHLERTGS